MARPERHHPAHLSAPSLARPAIGTDASGATGFQPGGQVGQMQAELVLRLTGGVVEVPADVASGERLVRFVSVAGGIAALVAGYTGAGLLLLR